MGDQCGRGGEIAWKDYMGGKYKGEGELHGQGLEGEEIHKAKTLWGRDQSGSRSLVSYKAQGVGPCFSSVRCTLLPVHL